MIFNKNRLALLAGIDNRDQYFGKTLRENRALYEEEGAEEEVPLDVEDEAVDADADLEAEAGDEEAVPKEEIADALAPLLGVDAEELSALVSGGEEEAGDEEEDLGGEEEAEEEVALESDVIVVDASEEDVVYADSDEELSGPAAVAERRLRRAIRKEIASVIKETRAERAGNDIRRARRKKSVAAIMGFDRKR